MIEPDCGGALLANNRSRNIRMNSQGNAEGVDHRKIGSACGYARRRVRHIIADGILRCFLGPIRLRIRRCDTLDASADRIDDIAGRRAETT
jgi:hypothetical protein